MKLAAYFSNNQAYVFCTGCEKGIKVTVDPPSVLLDGESPDGLWATDAHEFVRNIEALSAEHAACEAPKVEHFTAVL